MPLSRSAHLDTFTRDHLPPADQWPVFRFTLPELHYPERLNCAVSLLDDTITRYGPDRPCLHSDTTTWSYAELAVRSNQLAHVLVDDLGLVPGNRVLLRAPNTPWLVAAWLATLRAGCVVVTTVPQLRPAELRTVGEIARIDHSLVDDRYAADLAAADIAPMSAQSELTERAATKDTTFPACDTAADDVALLAFTSGTTGRPKATMHFHRDVLANADTFARHVLRPLPDDLYAGSPPLGFTFGLGGLVVFPLYAGAATLMIEKPSPDALLSAVVERGATGLFTAPTAYRAMVGALPAGGMRGLRRCVSAGEPLPRATWQAFHEATGVRIIDGIGATEMLHIFVSAAGDDIRPGATGRAVPGYTATVLDEDGGEAPDDTVGRLAVRGPTGCRYLADPRQTDYVQRGWNITGDSYVRDRDGYLWYQARSDDMIISSGYNIAGPEVEQALLEHPDVVEAGVVGTPDPARTMSVVGYVVLRPGATVGEDDLKAFCKARIAPYKCPRAVVFVEALPRTSTGKLMRHELRARATR
ncbi:AMP-binding protein [Actinocatenispora rupis]|uniref:AMP-dependent synthetase n=1 Tax=Actinocatenispora rupis TaxID=519421 RepID=A0A8J3JDM0_9ACTN|nr:AMP-binding protein [Actinocatenispora rupis]GID14023.1 AMP-dependent synthetase [Actinocatenispora rupis]